VQAVGVVFDFCRYMVGIERMKKAKPTSGYPLWFWTSIASRERWENSIFRCKWSICTKSSTGGFKIAFSLFSV